MDKKNTMKRAYRTTWKGVTSIVAAESGAQARIRTQATAEEAGYKPRWVDIRARRAPEYDGWAAVDESKHCWAEDQLENCRDKKQNSSR